MSRPPFAIAAVLLLSAGAAACAPQCTCPATVPAPAGVIAVATPGAPQPVVGGPLRIVNEEKVLEQMRSVYPPSMASAGVRGDALMEVTLDENGTVQSATDIRVSNTNFRVPALTIAHGLQFSAPPAAGTVVRVRLRWALSGLRVEIVQP
ncbi:hypothetical protein [Longimicrobium sp.]|uniref:hypothetical protein n=1 Tax=Longimicrobium sp. TaxID=2029185 RepID=UPI003B3B90EB